MSACGTYRYELTRTLRPGRSGVTGSCVFIMLNPSTADADTDDPTIRRCIGFAAELGHAHLVVVNLFAYRATEPRELGRVAAPCGRRNGESLRRWIRPEHTVIAAWGAFARAIPRAARVQGWAREAGVELQCLRCNADGSPGHPLYLPKSSRLRRWSAGFGTP